MVTTYRLNVDDLSGEILKSIKAAFKGKEIQITVTEANDIDETEYLLSSEANKRMIRTSIQELEEGKGVSMTIEELQEKYGNG